MATRVPLWKTCTCKFTIFNAWCVFCVAFWNATFSKWKFTTFKVLFVLRKILGLICFYLKTTYRPFPRVKHLLVLDFWKKKNHEKSQHKHVTQQHLSHWEFWKNIRPFLALPKLNAVHTLVCFLRNPQGILGLLYLLARWHVKLKTDRQIDTHTLTHTLARKETKKKDT